MLLFFKIALIELLVGKNDFTAIQNLDIFIFWSEILRLNIYINVSKYVSISACL